MFNLKESIRATQFLPDTEIEATEMIGEDRHLYFLIATLTDDEINELVEKRNENREDMTTKVRFKLFTCINAEIEKYDKVYRIEIQEEDD